MQNSKKIIRRAFRVSAFILISVLLFILAATVGFAAEGELGTMSGKGTDAAGAKKLCPGGIAFGVRFSTEGVLIVGVSEVKSGGSSKRPADEGGLRVRDVIISIDGKAVNGIASVSDAVDRSGGKPIIFTVLRDGKKESFTVTPVTDDADGKYKTGLWLRDSSAGIGTVTYIDPETYAFGGLGHGICDTDTGELMTIQKGSAMNVRIGGVVRGKSGRPGELKGYFLPERIGNVVSNTLCGVFGAFSKLPDGIGEAIPIGSRYDIEEGKAEIFCTLGDDGRRCYEVTISKIDRGGTDNKNFVVTVTDDALIERTGGIVQGMSGSPIIQNGKLIGAVTHVLISNPKVGYGIFIENMLSSVPSEMK